LKNSAIKEHFVEQTVERIKRHAEYIDKESLQGQKEMAADYHEKIDRLEQKIEELKAAGDTGSEWLSDLEWAKDKLKFTAMNSRIEKLENTLEAYDKVIKSRLQRIRT